jgi:hypothetical protein
MRKTIATLVAVAATVAAFGTAAGPAAADDPNATHTSAQSFFDLLPMQVCATPNKRGVLGQYGASGYYIDGCTTYAMTCPSVSPFSHHRPVNFCRATMNNLIQTSIVRGDGVTMNARIRRFSSSGQVIGWLDKSCSGANSCTTEGSIDILPGESVTTQCNGVRAALIGERFGTLPANSAMVQCTEKTSFQVTF